MAFTDKQVAELNAKLESDAVKTRQQAGRNLSYIEGWHAIAEANRIFGFDAWDRETTELLKCGEPEEIDNKWRVRFICRCRVTVYHGDSKTVREGTGYGSGIDRDLGGAYEGAVKEAETDAMKRALMTFGNPFGLALYDKDQKNVTARKSAAQAKRDGDDQKIKDMLAQASTVDDLDSRWQLIERDMMPELPLSWHDPMHDLYENRRDELKGTQA